MRLRVQRRPSVDDAGHPGKKVTYGSLYVDDVLECFTLEDEIREKLGVPVAQWKVFAETAMPSSAYAGHDYELGLVDSPKFGPDTLSLKNVPGFDSVRIHSVTDVNDTEGCLGVGDAIDEGHGQIRGGKAHQVLAKLKEKVIGAMSRGEKVVIEIRNPEEAAP